MFVPLQTVGLTGNVIGRLVQPWEEEARAFLIGMAEEATVRLGAILDGELIHLATLSGPIPRVSQTPGTTP